MMPAADTYATLSGKFEARFGKPHEAAAFAPGRVEILGNHTDYNEGYVLSAAVGMGVWFLAAPAREHKCRVVAGDIGEETEFDPASDKPVTGCVWANYVKGVFVKLKDHGLPPKPFLGMFLGNLPLASGLSSSAALEISTAMALCRLHDIHVDPMKLALAGQSAEHEFVGVKCGLLDQITSLYGLKDHLVLTDFRSLAVKHVPFRSGNNAQDVCFLVCNTGVKHTLVESEYNQRRAQCERSAAYFASALGRPVKSLRDVGERDWKCHSSGLDPTTARRALHIIGENRRVIRGADCLSEGRMDLFGSLMFESHESSRNNFENSCPELDFLVRRSAGIPGVLGARLSGGGFGGSAVVLADRAAAGKIIRDLQSDYRDEFNSECEIRVAVPSDGAIACR